MRLQLKGVITRIQVDVLAFDGMLGFVKHHVVMNALPAWLLNADEGNKTVVYERGNLIFVFNWGPHSIPDYEIPGRSHHDEDLQRQPSGDGVSEIVIDFK